MSQIMVSLQRKTCKLDARFNAFGALYNYIPWNHSSTTEVHKCIDYAVARNSAYRNAVMKTFLTSHHVHIYHFGGRHVRISFFSGVTEMTTRAVRFWSFGSHFIVVHPKHPTLPSNNPTVGKQ